MLNLQIFWNASVGTLTIEIENIVGTWVGKFYSHGNKTTLDFTKGIVSKHFIFQTIDRLLYS